MKLHSYSNLVTNSSTETYSRITSKEKMYELLQGFLDLLGMDSLSTELFEIEEELDDPEVLFGWVSDVIMEEDEELAEQYPMPQWERETVWDEYQKEKRAVVEKMLADGVISIEQFMGDRDESGYDTKYVVKYKGTDKTLDVRPNLFNTEAYYN